MMDICEIVGCDEEARYYGPQDSKLCESCMDQDKQENDYDDDEYEFISYEK